MEEPPLKVGDCAITALSVEAVHSRRKFTGVYFFAGEGVGQGVYLGVGGVMDEDAALIQKLRQLTPPQMAVFQLRCQAQSIAEIAQELSISESRVKLHLANIYRKLEIAYLPREARAQKLQSLAQTVELLGTSDLPGGTGYD
jgi:DNA-binding CsgD family transcriptional regulator